MDNLKGKTAFITGGASGIGLAAAKALAAEGVNIVIVDLRQNAIDEALKIFEENEWSAIGIKLDVTDREAYEKAADEAEAKFGKLHILINNAGIAGANGPLWAVSYKDTDIALDINLRAVLNGIQVVVPRMIKHGESGYIVSTASKAALIPVPGCGLYNLTKQAVIGITETLASDLKDTNISAGVFCPGPFSTSLGQSSMEVTAEKKGEKLQPIAPPPPPPPDAKPPAGSPSMEDFMKLTRSADEAGQRILRGIKRGDLYIFTHSDFKKGFEARTNAMLRAFPDEPVNELFGKAFSFLVNNPVFDKQKEVPAFDK